MANSKTVRLKAETFERLSKYAVGFMSPDQVVNRALDLLEAKQKEEGETPP